MSGTTSGLEEGGAEDGAFGGEVVWRGAVDGLGSWGGWRGGRWFGEGDGPHVLGGGHLRPRRAVRMARPAPQAAR
jgi:hypothetical protein